MNRIVRKISNTLGVSGPTRKDSVIEGRSDFLIDPLIFAQKVNIGLGENGGETRGLFCLGPVHRLCSIIEDEEGEITERAYHPLFCEMLKLFDIRSENRFSAVCWREVSRWIKYEETVETESNRWSKPHITLLTLQCLLQLRNSIRSGAELMLDVNVDKFSVLAEKIVENWSKMASLSRAEMKACKDILMAPKYQLVGSKYGCGREGKAK
ncbi:Band 3 cyto domain containing protein [Trichuris trichiura]|uniref:Band 3 cyto domain containing protein n=1 Tax=Trichuris trichiura TaxID=36087 RepID=A0A077ZB72_TRITR|nr:Band 3 cyto domain containing protein [Trichuris trichiura]